MSEFLATVLEFAKCHRKKIVALLVIVLIYAISVQFISVSLSFVRGFGAVATDRWQMNRVNRIAITTTATSGDNQRSWIIEDRTLVRAFVRETRVARHASSQNSRTLYLRLYAGDVLVREMYLGDSIINIDASNSGHVFFYGNDRAVRSARNGYSQTVLSQRLERRINQYLRETP